MQIKPTEQAVALATLAVEIQNASNPAPVIGLLQRSQAYFSCYGSAASLNNPVSKSILNKLNHLAGMSQSCMNCHNECIDLANGHTVII